MNQTACSAAFAKPVVPDLSPGVARLFTLLCRDEVGINDVAEELTLHPAVAARLIGLANSAWSSPINPVHSVHDACTRLGLGVVRSTAIAYSVSAPFNTRRCPSFDPLRFWCGCLLAAEAARSLADAEGLDPAVATTAAMLRNLGLLWLSDIEPEPTGTALLQAQESESTLTSLLTAALGMSHIQATAYLLEAWGFNDELLEAINEAAQTPMTATVRKAAQLADSAYLEMEPVESTDLKTLEEPELCELRDQLRTRMARTLELAKTIAA